MQNTIIFNAAPIYELLTLFLSVAPSGETKTDSSLLLTSVTTVNSFKILDTNDGIYVESCITNLSTAESFFFVGTFQPE
jgi:hypothetical protein